MFQNKLMLMYGNQIKYLEQVKRELEARNPKLVIFLIEKIT